MKGRKLVRWTVVVFLTTLLLTSCRRARDPLRELAQGVPDDTVIHVAEACDFRGRTSSVTIYADGTVSSTLSEYANLAQGTGHISQRELRRILLKFADIGFFSLGQRDLGCVYYVNHPPDSSVQGYCCVVDGTDISISITIHGMSNSIWYCTYDPAPWDPKLKVALDELARLILALDRFAGEPKIVTPTPSLTPDPVTPNTF